MDTAIENMTIASFIKGVAWLLAFVLVAIYSPVGFWPLLPALLVIPFMLREIKVSFLLRKLNRRLDSDMIDLQL